MRASGWHWTKLKAGPPPITAGGDAESAPEAHGLPERARTRALLVEARWTRQSAVPSGPAQCALAQLLPVGHPMKRTGLLREHQRSSTNRPEGCCFQVANSRLVSTALVRCSDCSLFGFGRFLPLTLAQRRRKDDSISTPSTPRLVPSPRAISCGCYRSVPSGQRVVARRVICC